MGRISNGCVVARVRWLTHTGREVSPSGLKSGGAKRFGECAFGLFFVGWVKRALPRKPIIEQGEAPDTLSILARDPLPLRLCAFAPLRSFLLTAGISARDPLPSRLCTFAPLRSFLPKGLTRGLPPHPPRPLLPQPKPWGRGGAKRFGGCAISPPAKAHAAHKASGAYHS